MTLADADVSPHRVDSADFQNCLARWPSGVAVVTTVDDSGVGRGFTATAFSSLSMSPPMVLVCLDESSNCRDAFATAPAIAIHLLRHDQRELAMRFATKGVDKFRGLPVERGIDGVPLLAGAVGRLQCSLVRRVPAGDHIILIGLVCEAEVAAGDPLVYLDRAFHAR